MRAAPLDQGSATCGSRATCGSLNPQLWLLLEANKDHFSVIIFGITEIFGPVGSFAAPSGFWIVTNGLFWLFKSKRLPTSALDHVAMCHSIRTAAYKQKFRRRDCEALY